MKAGGPTAEIMKTARPTPELRINISGTWFCNYTNRGNTSNTTKDTTMER